MTHIHTNITQLVFTQTFRVSNSREQIFQIMDQFIAENVKKGWTELI